MGALREQKIRLGSRLARRIVALVMVGFRGSIGAWCMKTGGSYEMVRRHLVRLCDAGVMIRREGCPREWYGAPKAPEKLRAMGENPQELYAEGLYWMGGKYVGEAGEGACEESL